MRLISRPGGYCPMTEESGIGAKAKEVSAQVGQLVRRGRVYPVKLGRRTVRYFGTQSAADLFALEANSRRPVAPGVTISPSAQRLAAGGEAIITPRTRVTVCPPSRDTRYYVDPATPVPGGFLEEFRAARGGRTVA